MADENDTVKVYCRVRPSRRGGECVKVEREGLRTIPPPGAKYNSKEAVHSFSGIFTEDSCQSDIYEDVANPLVDELVEGKNGLLFTYGVTGSGKTYTMQGDEDNPGIVPRVLKSLFNKIKVMSTRRVIPNLRNGFKVCSLMDAFDQSSRIRSQNRKPQPGIPCMSYLNKIKNEDNGNDKLSNCAIIISLVEIYGKHIRDLLSVKSDLQKEISIKEDVKKNKYLHNVVEIEVRTPEEAFSWYLEGQKNRKVESTKLNTESSRSHMLFNIRLVKLGDTFDDESFGWTSSPVLKQKNYSNMSQDFLSDIQTAELGSNQKLQCNYNEDEERMWVSHLSLVDLAGSERANRSGTQGTRLKEAGDINNSLMVLRRCMEMLREKNKQNCNKPDYRSSELTHLFKTSLEGGSTIRMIVCIQSCPEEYDETMNVLQFAEKTQDISIPIQKNPEPFKTNKINTMTSLTKDQCIEVKLNEIWSFVAQKRMLSEKNIDNITCILELKEKSDETLKIMSELWSMLMDESLSFNQDQLDAINLKLSKEKSINAQLKKEMSEMIKKSSEKEIELSQSKLEITSLRRNRTKQDEKIRALEYQLRCRDDSSQKTSNDKDPFRNVNTVSVKTMAKKFESSIECSSRKVINTIKPGPLPGASTRKGFFNPRYRRSKSNEEWVEHKEKNEIPMGTLNQVKVKFTEQSKNPSLDGLKKGGKYLLHHQIVKCNADVEMAYHKGNIIPTAGGGVAVSLYEIETVTQKSPFKRQQKIEKRHSSMDDDVCEGNSKRFKEDCCDST